MKAVDKQLNRLMKSAVRAQQPLLSGPAYGVEIRILANWRGARSEGGDFLVLWFGRATICAGLLAVASLAWNHYGANDRSSAEMVADSAMGMGVEQ